MNIIIFAGGIGSRLWPLSRENSPKQFDKIFSGKSTLQLAFDRVVKKFGAKHVYVQTVEKYQSLVQEQLLKLPKNNLLIEPARRDVGPAVCFSLLELKKRRANGPLAILWADHLIDREGEFIEALERAEEVVKKNPKQFVFLAERPRFANNNLGWIKVGKKMSQIKERSCYQFLGWEYRPEMRKCETMYRSGDYFWNPGYFITSLDFLISKYKTLAPRIYQAVSKDKYEEAEKINFDKAIIEKLDTKAAVILKTNMGWSDPGTLYALKEALEKNNKDNVTKGEVNILAAEDNLLYNLEKKKILAVVGLHGCVVVNTDDALLIAPKSEVVHITELLKKMKEEGKEQYL
ncbi:MAG: sugar phosphate nucleotidyltransferase [Planctomycetes bacterium]|jgi:mannose-1-phosphate guanylyltransferase|nr:sugar phosphate nucleotidyltransferase [Planctomycetota bacterium]